MISFQTNIDSLVAQQNLNTNSIFQSKTIQQLTSGYRINSSGDDAAGLAVANGDRDQIAQITQGVANGNNGTAQLQIMDGGMNNISQILDRLQSLATESASSTFTGNRTDLNSEFQTDIGELNRQAQAIGLNTGGTFAQSLDVYLGGGGGATASTIAQDGQVSIDLSKSTVDAQSLGLSGMQVVAGTTDIGSGSATHSVSQIVSNQSNTTNTAGVSTFYLSGPGFSDNSKVALSVNLSGVSNMSTLVTAVNNAITSASNGTSPAGQALKSANVTASINTDASGGQELAFSSSIAAFQVQAGDQMANALMGNLQSGSTGVAVSTSVTGASTAATQTPFSPTGVTVQISGASLANPVNLTFGSGVTSVDAAIASLKSQVQGSTALQAAGVTVSGTAGGALTFTSATGETFSVQATGDTNNVLGLGALNTSAAVSSPAFYSTITGVPPTSTGNGLATLGFSINGGPTNGANPSGTAATAATLTGTAPTGISAGGAVNTSALGTLTLSLNGTTGITVNMTNDANKGSAESLANVAKYINSQVDAAMGWGSDVKLASVAGSGASSTINLVDPYASSSSTLSVTPSTTATALGLAGTATTGSDGTGNTITLNLAGGDATAATYTGGAASANVNTSVNNAALNFTIDGQTVTAAFTNDGNHAGTGATFSGATNPVNTAGLLGAATFSSPLAAGLSADSSLTLTDDTNLTINGTVIDIHAATDLATVASAITSQTAGNSAASGGAVTAHEIVLSNGTYGLQLTSALTGSSAGIKVVNNQAAVDIGLATATSGSPTQVNGTTQQLSITIPGQNNGNPQLIDFSGDSHATGGESLDNVVSYVNAHLTGATASDATGALVITSTATGSAASMSMVNGAAAQALGLSTAGSGTPTTASGKDETLAQVVGFLNTQAQQQLGTSTAANVFTLNANNTIGIASQTKGATSEIALVAGSGITSTTGSIATALGLPGASATPVATGAGPSLGSIVTSLNQAFAANTTLQQAGLQASTSNGGTTLTIASSNNTNFRVDEYGAANTNLGFGMPGLTAGPFTGLTSGLSNASMIDAGGTSVLGTGSAGHSYLSFTPLKFGSDAQAVTVAANSGTGVLQSLTITLRNDSNPGGTEKGAQSGATVDSAVSFINSQLQQSNNATLQSIVAVKENVGGTEKINFISASPSFSVYVGSSANGNGMNGGVAQTFASVANGAATTASIDTLGGAQAAVTAVTAAVASLGNAQATIGKGENQLSYAVNLAQSQITNISAAESQIRDANVAQEAANLTKAQVLQQATIAAMAQANQEPQAVLSLLKG